MSTSRANAPSLAAVPGDPLPARRVRRLRLVGGMRVGLTILALVMVGAIWGQLAPPADPLRQDFSTRLQAPSFTHPLGTDEYGRDILSRLLVGATPSLVVAIGATLLAGALGVPIGALCAAGGWVGRVVSRLLDGVQAFPGLILALLLVTIIGAGYRTLILAIGLSFLPLIARVSEAAITTERARSYVQAAVTVGRHPAQVLIKHVFPNIVSPLLVQATTVLALALLTEATLSFLGLGPTLTAPTWGRMLFDARVTMELAPHTAIAPLVTVSLTVLGLNIVGDGLRDALDPTVSSQRIG